MKFSMRVPSLSGQSPSKRPRHPLAGAALLEVIIALALFVAMAAVMTSALSSSLDSLDRQRLNTHATNLASSILAELELGVRSTESSGPQPVGFPYEDWTWEAAITGTETETGEASGLTRVEVIVRHKSSPIVRRLAQFVNLDRTPRPTTRTPGA